MVCIILHSMVHILWSSEGSTLVETQILPSGNEGKVFLEELRNLDQKEYRIGLFRLIARLENEQKVKITPSTYPQIAIKIDTQRAPGLATSVNLLSSLIQILEVRGYDEESVTLVTYELDGGMMKTLFERFSRYSILTHVDRTYFHPDWFHDSPMPPSMGDRARLFITHPHNPETRKTEERKTLLPACLFLSDRYWINLATPKDDHILGIDGAITNVTLNASSNSERFREDSTMGPAAATEILAIPEIWEKHLFSLMDLSKMQIADGPGFNAEFIEQKNALLLSKNPVYLDYFTMETIRKERKRLGLRDRDPLSCKLFLYARELGLGNAFDSKLLETP